MIFEKKELWPALANIGQQTQRSAYDLNELSEQWKLIMERRIQEDPGTFVHSELKWR